MTHTPPLPDRRYRRHEIAVRARAWIEGLVPRSVVLEELTEADWNDPLLQPLLDTVKNAPKKSRTSGLWGRAWDAFVKQMRLLIDAADPPSDRPSGGVL